MAADMHTVQFRVCSAHRHRGVARAKKHKAFAEEARRAWAQLKRTRGGRVWMKHVGTKDPDYLAAGALARAGKQGQSDYSETVN